MSAVIAVLAEDINREHELATSHAERAIQHAIRCGNLLNAKKAELPHGEFLPWIAANCAFKYSTAARYMKAATQNLYGVEILRLSDLFPSGRLPTTDKSSTCAASIMDMVRNASRDVLENEAALLRSEADDDHDLLQAGDVAAAARTAPRIERWEQISDCILDSIVQETGAGLARLGLTMPQIRSFHVAMAGYLADGIPFVRAFARAAVIIFACVDVHLNADEIGRAADALPVAAG